ncbi:MAG: Nramp family divalent metal transporter [Candidatus Methanomethylicia archaeon]
MSRETFKFGIEPIEVIDKLPTPEEVFGVSKLTTGNLITKVLGPAVIVLGVSIGSGEWLMGPSVAARYGLYLFWLVWVGAFLQTVWNCSFARITIATGESATRYLNRVPPGKWLWSPLTIILAWLGWAWPGWAATSATAVMAMILGKIPGAEHATTIRYIGIVLFLICLLILAIGYKIERTLEIFNWVFGVGFTLFSMIFIICPITVTWDALREAAQGVVSVGYIPRGVDVLLLGGWWGYIGYATGLNILTSGYYRDKGYGVGSLVGYIPAIIGGRKIAVSPTGKMFRLTKENLEIWRKWVKILKYDQYGIFFIGALFGMFLPALAVRSVTELGTSLPTWGVAAHIAEQFAAKVGPWGFYYISLVGIACLIPTQLGVIDVLIRTTTDTAWIHGGVRNFFKNDIRILYYTLNVIYILFASWAIWQTAPLILTLIAANMANVAAVFFVPAVLYLNTKLPKELKPGAWEYIALIIFWLLCIFFATAMILGQFFGIKIL